MNSNEKLIKELEDAITTVQDQCDTSDPHIVQLIRKTAEAVAVLRLVGDVDMKVIMYDMARLAAQAGWTPEDFDKKAQR